MTTLLIMAAIFETFLMGVFVGAWLMHNMTMSRQIETDDGGDGEPMIVDETNVVPFAKGNCIKRGAEIYQVIQ